MVTIRTPDLDLEQTARSGQCFRMNRTEEGAYTVDAFGTRLYASQQGEEITFSCSQEEWDRVWYDYFDMGTDYQAIKRLIPAEDAYLTSAAAFGGGIRILKQDLWEMIISFLISQNNNIPRIKKSIELLCGTLNGGAFPSPEQIADAGPRVLSQMGLGYRDQYVYKMAVAAADKTFDLESLKAVSHEEAHKRLMGCLGIGKKVADCICLFGLHHIDAFPVDTHIKKILDAHYPEGFPYGRYQGYLGIVQQYLFYYDFCKEGR